MEVWQWSSSYCCSVVWDFDINKFSVINKSFEQRYIFLAQLGRLFDEFGTLKEEGALDGFVYFYEF